MPSFSSLLRRPSFLLRTFSSSSSRKPPPDKAFHPSTLHSGDPRDLLPNQALALVAASQANFMRVIVESAGGPPEIPSPNLLFSDARVGRELLCVVRTLLKKIRRRVLAGDRVLVGSVDWGERRGVIEDVFERKSEIVDPPVANVDQMLVVFSMEQPKLEPFALTRFLVEAESSGVPFTLAINKLELVGEETLSSWKERLHSWGYKPLFCSVDHKSGLAALEDILKGKTTMVVGPSGVGKSSLVNSLRSNRSISEEEEINTLFYRNEVSGWLGEQRVDTVSKKSGIGKHTTRNISLLPLTSGGFIADTPGLNQPSLLKVTKKTLANTFPEIRQMLMASEPAKCSFSNCLHIGEPGCVMKMDWERYPYYFQLLDEIKIREQFQLRMFGTKRESDVRYKVGDMGIKHEEPRLEPKKYRRVSRKRLKQSILDDVDDDLEEDSWSDVEESAT